jgi:hypothetical protein
MLPILFVCLQPVLRIGSDADADVVSELIDVVGSGGQSQQLHGKDKAVNAADVLTTFVRTYYPCAHFQRLRLLTCGRCSKLHHLVRGAFEKLFFFH